MILGISEDFSSSVSLDSQLKALPSSGLYLNSGVHPSITVDNLLNFLPKQEFTFTSYNVATTYGSFLASRKRTDIVTYNSKIYQSIQGTNVGNDPEEVDSEYWLETNIESLRLKIFIEQVKDRVKSDLALTRRLVNNQYLYKDGDTAKELPNDYAGWVLEPKGSDYVTIRVNQVSLQKDGTTPVSLYIVEGNELIDTLTVTPNNGMVNFQNVDIVSTKKAPLKLVIDSTDVYVGNATIDPFKFNGLTAYTTFGTGNDPETATYTYNTFDNGIGINVTAYMDGSTYIDNNFVDLANYIRATFTLMVFELFLHNSNNRSNRSQRIQMNDDILIQELKNMNAETVIRKYHREKKKAIESMERTFDTQLNNRDGLEITVGSV